MPGSVPPLPRRPPATARPPPRWSRNAHPDPPWLGLWHSGSGCARRTRRTPARPCVGRSRVPGDVRLNDRALLGHKANAHVGAAGEPLNVYDSRGDGAAFTVENPILLTLQSQDAHGEEREAEQGESRLVRKRPSTPNRPGLAKRDVSRHAGTLRLARATEPHLPFGGDENRLPAVLLLVTILSLRDGSPGTHHDSETRGVRYEAGKAAV